MRLSLTFRYGRRLSRSSPDLQQMQAEIRLTNQTRRITYPRLLGYFLKILRWERG
jgi:hypothetical protein